MRSCVEAWVVITITVCAWTVWHVVHLTKCCPHPTSRGLCWCWCWQRLITDDVVINDSWRHQRFTCCACVVTRTSTNPPRVVRHLSFVLYWMWLLGKYTIGLLGCLFIYCHWARGWVDDEWLLMCAVGEGGKIPSHVSLCDMKKYYQKNKPNKQILQKPMM